MMFKDKDKPRQTRWAKWTAEQHIDEAQRLVGLGYTDRANVHATLAVQRTLMKPSQGSVAVL